jgi:peptidoglycan/LPS O-acetylase OafA/YrhL
LSYELYLFHLIVLGLMRAGFPPQTISGGAKMVLLPAYFMMSAALAQAISRAFSVPMNRIIRGT